MSYKSRFVRDGSDSIQIASGNHTVSCTAIHLKDDMKMAESEIQFRVRGYSASLLSGVSMINKFGVVSILCLFMGSAMYFMKKSVFRQPTDERGIIAIQV
ncbi:hypothetical protein ACOME3_008871 [Neoechinorhynchus agilis]